MKGIGAYDILDQHLVDIYINKAFDQLTILDIQKLPYYADTVELVILRNTYSMRRKRYRTKFIVRSTDPEYRASNSFPKRVTCGESECIWKIPSKVK